MELSSLFDHDVRIEGNLIEIGKDSVYRNQEQTNSAFSEKWNKVKEVVSDEDRSVAVQRQRNWFLSLYGFSSFSDLEEFAKNQAVMLDAGCGLGEKSAWFAEMNPNAIVIGMDFSESVYLAAKKFNNRKNLFFIRGDIANTPFKRDVFDFVFCDQVIMHTENPEKTFDHLSSLVKKEGEFACYVYRKKALPRELLDDYFRKETHNFSKEEMWEFSEQLTELGKNLSDLNVQIDVPDIPVLGVKGGQMDIQRFIYWNFLKCFWNEELGRDTSISCNFDWYAPSNAKRYSKEEFMSMIEKNDLNVKHFHSEPACYSGRFIK